MWEMINAIGVIIALFALLIGLIATVVAMEKSLEEDDE